MRPNSPYQHKLVNNWKRIFVDGKEVPMVIYVVPNGMFR